MMSGAPAGALTARAYTGPDGRAGSRWHLRLDRHHARRGDGRGRRCHRPRLHLRREPARPGSSPAPWRRRSAARTCPRRAALPPADGRRRAQHGPLRPRGDGHLRRRRGAVGPEGQAARLAARRPARPRPRRRAHLRQSGGFTSYDDAQLTDPARRLGGARRLPRGEDEGRHAYRRRPAARPRRQGAIGDATLFVDANGAYSARTRCGWPAPSPPSAACLVRGARLLRRPRRPRAGPRPASRPHGRRGRRVRLQHG